MPLICVCLCVCIRALLFVKVDEDPFVCIHVSISKKLALKYCLFYIIESDNITFIRLVGGHAPNKGRLEVYYGQWGTVCDDGFGYEEAHIVCRKLGFISAYSYECCAEHGQGSGPIWLDNLACTGTEESLHDCPHNGIGNHNCEHDEDAGVTCHGIA